MKSKSERIKRLKGKLAESRYTAGQWHDEHERELIRSNGLADRVAELEGELRAANEASEAVDTRRRGVAKSREDRLLAKVEELERKLAKWDRFEEEAPAVAKLFTGDGSGLARLEADRDEWRDHCRSAEDRIEELEADVQSAVGNRDEWRELAKKTERDAKAKIADRDRLIAKQTDDLELFDALRLRIAHLDEQNANLRASNEHFEGALDEWQNLLSVPPEKRVKVPVDVLGRTRPAAVFFTFMFRYANTQYATDSNGRAWKWTEDASGWRRCKMYDHPSALGKVKA